MDDAELVARLRNGPYTFGRASGEMVELNIAADRIEALSARLAKAEALAEALRAAYAGGDGAEWCKRAANALALWEA